MGVRDVWIELRPRAADAPDLNTSLAPPICLCYRYSAMAQPKWRQKMCPLLTVGVVKPPSILAGADGKPPEMAFDAIPCQGEACAWFIQIVDEHGRITDGQCAVPLGCAGVGQLVNVGVLALQGLPGAAPRGQAEAARPNGNTPPDVKLGAALPVIPNKP